MKKVYASSLIAFIFAVLISNIFFVFVEPAKAKGVGKATTSKVEDSKKSIQATITKLTSPVKPGEEANISIKTEPGALCRIEVKLKSGISKAAALKTQRADDKGVATWTWKIAANAAAGDWPVTIECSLKGAGKGTALGTLKIAK
jgi:hypothetical protein